MRLMEAIIDANHRAIAGDTAAGLHPSEFAQELPLVALTCIDARLNALFPQVLGVPADAFVWLRNAGNIITGPMSSTMRSLALACAVKGGKEIAIIGHSDCMVAKTSAMQLMDALQSIGVQRNLLPANIGDYFGIFGNERQNVSKGVEVVRKSPLIGTKIPVHGLLVDTATGKLDWLVNGYQAAEAAQGLGERWQEVVKSAEQTVDAFKSLTDFKIGGTNFSETKIGEIVSTGQSWVAEKLKELEAAPPAEPVSPPQTSSTPAAAPPPLPPKISANWAGVRPRIIGKRGPK